MRYIRLFVLYLVDEKVKILVLAGKKGGVFHSLLLTILTMMLLLLLLRWWWWRKRGVIHPTGNL